MSVVVSDASALIALEQIGQLALLERLFATLLIPPAVRPHIDALLAADFRVAPDLVERILADAGESE